MDVREKLVELLLQEDNVCEPSDCKYCGVKGSCGYYRTADRLIANGVTVQEWISVDDRLPENGQEVFVAYVFPLQHRTISKHFYSASIYYIDDGNGLVNRPHFENEGFHGMRVTHWMPMPEPPKGE